MSYYSDFGVDRVASDGSCPPGFHPGPAGPTGNRYCLPDSAPAAASVPDAASEWNSYPPAAAPPGPWVPGTPIKMTNQPLPYAAEPVDNSPGFDWGGMANGLVSGLVNIFGQRQPPPRAYYPPPPPAIPQWVWIAAPVGLLAVIMLATSGRKASVAGYKRRKSRRRAR